MRFQLIKYVKAGESHFRFAVKDSTCQYHQVGAYLIADQSIYPEDNGKLVWKNAAYPDSIHFGIKNDPNYQVIAEANFTDLLVVR